jgi:hypothetical protein
MPHRDFQQEVAGHSNHLKFALINLKKIYSRMWIPDPVLVLKLGSGPSFKNGWIRIGTNYKQVVSRTGLL